MMLLRVLGVFVLASTALALSSTAHIKAASGPQAIKRRNDALRRLTGKARKEFDQLSGTARATAEDALSHARITEADADNVHFNAKGHLFFADPVNKHHANENLLKDEKEESDGEQRRRRSLSDAQPDRFLASGLPIYHSKPGSNNIIILDFDGHAETARNSEWGAFNNAGYNPRGSAGEFDSIEQREIGLMWARVAEDYAPFDVDVTTEEPSVLTRTTLRCLIASNRDRNGKLMPAADDAGGVAYLGIFNSRDTLYFSPAFVYWENLGGGRNDYMAEVASHELGHNLGLSHDGTSREAYYRGDEDPSNPVSWAPIMGISDDSSVTQWSKGEYADANNFEDDVAILARQLNRRADEAGASTSTAGVVTSTNDGAGFKATGIISGRSEVDWWRIEVTGSGVLALTVVPWRASRDTAGANLDVIARLRSSSGALLQTSAPSGRTDASLTRTVSPGTYYVEVDGEGEGSRYSDYSSLGQYNIEGARPVGAVGDTTTTTAAASTTTTTKVVTTTTTPRPVGGLSCPTDDSFEANDSPSTAPNMPPNSVTNAIVCGSNEDWYAVKVCGNGQLDASITFTHSVGDLDLAAYYDGDMVAISDGLDNFESTSVINTGRRELVLHLVVYSWRGDDNTYTMRLESTGCAEPTTTRATTTATTTIVAATTTTAHGDTCVNGVNSCAKCADRERCEICGYRKYLLDGVCLSGCPAGYRANGNRRRGRVCIRTAPETTTSPGSATTVATTTQAETPCVDGRDNCRRCATHTRCRLCKNEQYLSAAGACLSSCPAGYRESGTAQRGRQCIAIGSGTTKLPEASTTTPVPPASTCVSGRNSCHRCATEQRCGKCAEMKYLLLGECVSSCPSGYRAEGNGRKGRECQGLVATSSTASPDDLSPGAMRQTVGCLCAGSSDTKSSVRRTWDGLVVFCLERTKSKKQAWAVVRAETSSGVFMDRAGTVPLKVAGDTVCAVYRPRAGEENAVHEVDIEGRNGVIRYKCLCFATP